MRWLTPFVDYLHHKVSGSSSERLPCVLSSGSCLEAVTKTRADYPMKSGGTTFGLRFPAELAAILRRPYHKTAKNDV